MSYLVLQYVAIAIVIVTITKITKISYKIGALVICLPLMTILSLKWAQVDGGGIAKPSNHAYFAFWYILPTIHVSFVFLKFLKRFGFWTALAISVIGTAALFLGYAMVMKRFGIELLP